MILVVDDEDDARIFLSSILSSAGYRVATCTDGFEALRSLARIQPNLVITDARMPGLEGLELLSKIKFAAPRTPVILWSAYADWAMFDDAMERGGADVLAKPSSNDDLLRAVGHYVGVKS